jgi:6-phosphogluconolactonase (cycloisomerase 2 family)
MSHHISHRIARGRRAAMISLVSGAAATFTAFGFSPAASAASPTAHHHAVFVHTNDPTSNAVIVYDRASDGLLTEVKRYATGGKGGSESGAVADPLASQGSLTYDAAHSLLFAVNAGSDTVTVFEVHGTRLQRIQTIASGGVLPTSVGVAQSLVYVLNASGDGGISGFRIGSDNRLHPIANSTRSLGLGNPANPNFLKSPSQVAITPDATAVVVATKTNGVLDVFKLKDSGAPEQTPVTTTSVGPVPFALNFDAAERLLVAEANGAETSYQVQSSGALAAIGQVPNGQAATCWSVLAKGFVYVSNSGSNTITGYSENASGVLSLLNPSGVTATTDAAPVDIAASRDGNYLYQEATRAGAIDEFKVNDDGSLTWIGALTGLPIDNGSGIEGIAAS